MCSGNTSSCPSSEAIAEARAMPSYSHYQRNYFFVPSTNTVIKSALAFKASALTIKVTS